MKKLKIYITLAVSLMVFGTSFAQQSDSLSLENYLGIAAQNNPGVKATFNQYLAALEKVPQVGSLPDPQASFGFFLKPMAILGGNQVANVEVMQMFPWFGTLQTAKDEASAMANAKFEQFNSAKAELFYKVKANAYELMKLDREIGLVQENIELLESLEKLVLVKFESPASGGSSNGNMNSGSMSSASGGMNATGGGMGGMNALQSSQPIKTVSSQGSAMNEGMGSKQAGLQDVLRVKMEILEQKNRLALLSDQRQTDEARFNALLNRDLKTPVQFSDALVPQLLANDKLTYTDSIINNNPMLAMIENEISAYASMKEKAKKMGYPMLGVGVNYMINQKREGNTFMMNGNDMVMPMLSVSIPVYRKKYDSMQKEAQLMQEAGQLQAIDLKNDLLVEHRNFVQNLDDAERRLSLYQEQEKLARKTTDLLLTGFANTGTNYEEVLRMQYKVLDYGFKYIEAVTDYNTSIALVEKLMNSTVK